MPLFTSRRRFIEITPFAGLALVGACSPKPEPAAPATNSAPPAPSIPEPTPAPAGNTAVLPMLDEKDVQAAALGYVEDATKADTTRFKNYVAGNQCSNCALYLGKVEELAGPCPLFVGKNVKTKGWCTSWVKKV